MVSSILKDQILETMSLNPLQSQESFREWQLVELINLRSRGRFRGGIGMCVKGYLKISFKVPGFSQGSLESFGESSSYLKKEAVGAKVICWNKESNEDSYAGYGSSGHERFKVQVCNGGAFEIFGERGTSSGKSISELCEENQDVSGYNKFLTEKGKTQFKVEQLQCMLEFYKVKLLKDKQQQTFTVGIAGYVYIKSVSGKATEILCIESLLNRVELGGVFCWQQQRCRVMFKCIVFKQCFWLEAEVLQIRQLFQDSMESSFWAECLVISVAATSFMALVVIGGSQSWKKTHRPTILVKGEAYGEFFY
ncbi:unnamed protein product [Microthlaspi erraticum]|nr:unnamed protein product [Microthlaspi erraticum]